MKLGLIGYGNFATVLTRVPAREGSAVTSLDVLARPGAILRDAKRLPAATIHEDVAVLIDTAPDLVVELATHDAVRDIVPACLRASLPTVVVSVGALADTATEATLTQAAIAGGAQLRLVPGAVGGIDMLAAARLSGLSPVTYTSRKPPAARAGTPPEHILSLGTLSSAAIFHEGTARQAAQDYPRNANVAATVALAGLGFDETRVKMIGDPEAPGTQVAPLINHAHRDNVEACIDLAKAEGDEILTGGFRPDVFPDGAYLTPTILAGLPNTSRTCREEIFGPVLVVLPFEDEADAIAQANDNDYGQACGIWTRDFPRAWRVAGAIRAGTVWINTYMAFSISTPFGGDGAGGMGREKGREGLRARPAGRLCRPDRRAAPLGGSVTWGI